MGTSHNQVELRRSYLLKLTMQGSAGSRSAFPRGSAPSPVNQLLSAATLSTKPSAELVVAHLREARDYQPGWWCCTKVPVSRQGCAGVWQLGKNAVAMILATWPRVAGAPQRK